MKFVRYYNGIRRLGGGGLYSQTPYLSTYDVQAIMLLYLHPILYVGTPQA